MAESSNAPTKLFAVPELLENILLHLSPRSLFGVQRTSKAFRDTIAGSKKLQRTMHLLLPAAGVVTGPQRLPHDALSPMLLYSDILHPIIFGPAGAGYGKEQINPLLNYCENHRPLCVSPSEVQLDMFVYRSIKVTRKVLREKAIESWNHMLLATETVRADWCRVRVRTKTHGLLTTLPFGIALSNMRTLGELRGWALWVLDRLEAGKLGLLIQPQQDVVPDSRTSEQGSDAPRAERGEVQQQWKKAKNRKKAQEREEARQVASRM